MPQIQLFLSHCGQSVFGSKSAAHQSDDSDAAATSLHPEHFVCAEEAGWSFAPPGLPLSLSSTKRWPTATRAGGQSRFHRQFAASVNPKDPCLFSPAGSAHQPRGRRRIGAVAPATSQRWLSAGPERLRPVCYTIIQVVMLPPNWPKFIICWCRSRPT